MPVKVMCPGCNKSFNAPDDLVGKKVKCPSCKTSFVIESPRPVHDAEELDKPPSPPHISHLHEPNSERDLFDYAVYFALGAIPVLLLLGLGMLLLGYSDVVALLGATCFLISLVFFAKYSKQNALVKRQSEMVTSLTSAVSIRTEELRDAVHKFRSFQENFDSLVRKEFSRLKSEFADAEQKFEFAENRQKTIDQLGKRFLADSVKWISSKMT